MPESETGPDLLDDYLLHDQPEKVMIVPGSEKSAFEDLLRSRTALLTVTAIEQLHETVAQHGRQSLLLFHGSLDSCAREDVSRVLAVARDLYAARTVVMSACDPLDEAQPVTRNFMFSMGFRSRGGADNSDISLYEYHIHDYKTVPDWLNARFWANPENWGKYRW